MAGTLGSSAEGLAIVRASAPDVPAIERIVNAAYAKYIERIGKPPAPMMENYDESIKTQDIYVLRHTESHKVLGAITLGTESDPTALEIKNLVVDPESQGHGYGRVLMDYAETTALEHKRPALILYTNVKMFENLDLYPRMGFRETGRRTEDGYERVFFRKDLN